MSSEIKWPIGIALALAGLILQQSASLRADIRALDGRVRVVEQVQAQHGLLLQLLAQRVDPLKPSKAAAAGRLGGPSASGLFDVRGEELSGKAVAAWDLT